LKKLLGLTSAVLLIVAFGTVGTWAYFTDSELSSHNSLLAGTLDLTWQNTGGVNLPFNVPSLAPGESHEARLTINNTGNLPLRYAMTVEVASGETLANQLQCRVYDYETSTELYSGPLGAASFGDPGAEAVLAAGESRPVAITVTMPASTGREFQGLTSNVSFIFTAEQVTDD